MTNVDLSKLSMDELKVLQKEAARAVVDFEARRFQKVRDELEEVAASHGYKLADFTGGKKRTAKTVGSAKYRNPDNASQTGTGKGRRPDWIKAGLAAGKSLEDFAN